MFLFLISPRFVIGDMQYIFRIPVIRAEEMAEFNIVNSLKSVDMCFIPYHVSRTEFPFERIEILLFEPI